MLRVALGAIVLAGVLMSLTGTVASAHVGSTQGTSTIRQDGSVVRYGLQMAYQRMTDAAQLGPVPPEKQEAERTAFLAAHRERLAAYLTDRVRIELDGVRCAGELDSTGIALREAVQYARVLLVYRCPASSGEFTVRYEVFSEADSVGADHKSIVDYQLGGGSGRDVFDSGHHELRVAGSPAADPSAQSQVVAAQPSVLSSLARFVVLGLEHILGGVDHLLFLMLLLLGARGWRSVIRLVTSFTVAHSVTLALAALGWVEVPSGIVEPLIAASIVYVAVENVVRGETRYRVLVVFGFGLLHGLGFAGALSFGDESGGRLIGSLLSFNLGIELGQVALVLLVFPLLLLVRRHSWSKITQIGVAALVGVIGLWWVIERLPLAGAGSTPAAASTATSMFTPIADTYVDSGSSETNFGTSTQFGVDNSPIRRTFLKFSVTNLSGAVSSAKLRVHVQNNPGADSNDGSTFKAMTNTSWSETGVTYNNQPAIDGTTLGSLRLVAQNTWYEVDVTPLITGNGTFSIGVTSSGSDGTDYDSRETGSNAPQLVVTTK